MNRKKKWFLAATAVLVLFLFLFPYLEVFVGGSWIRWTLRNDLEVHLVPQQYSLVPAQASKDRHFYTFQSLTFEPPFSERGEKIRNAETVLPLRWDNKELLVFESFSWADNFLESREAEEINAVETIFGRDTLDSNYAFYSKMVMSTPADIDLFPPSVKTITYSILTTLKSVTIPDAEKILSFQSPSIRGYQFLLITSEEEPRIVVEIFDKNDRPYTLVFTNFSQGEADFLLNSIK